MPFTFSHPVVILPFRKMGSVTALVMGSLVPDFQGFIILDTKKEFSHSWTGVFLLDLPLALLLCYIFHGVVRRPLIDSFPGYFQRRFASFNDFDWVSYVKENRGKVFLSLLAGIVSHILWDQLTHPGSIIPGMESRIQLLGLNEPLFVFIQYTCSVPALLIQAIVIHRLPTSNLKTSSSSKAAYWIRVVVVLIGVIVYSLMNYHHHRYYSNILINTCISGLLTGVMISSLFCLKRSKAKRVVRSATSNN